VVEHLLSNALKFTDTGGKVTIRLRPDEEWLTCEVADTGIGIPPEYHKSIFEAFVQVSEKMYLEYGGLGIGLSFAKILVEQQGGRIWVESREGEGARFFFSLPRHASSHRRGGTDRLEKGEDEA
jgi:signal transduction histidine kinase